jgi:hypothetical protein
MSFRFRRSIKILPAPTVTSSAPCTDFDFRAESTIVEVEIGVLRRAILR